MARKPPAPSYAKFALDPVVAESPVRSTGDAGADTSGPFAKEGAIRQTLKQVAKTHLLYLHPAASKQLQRYAVEQSGDAEVKVHDLLIEAVQDWFDKHGLRGPIRALPRRVRGNG